MVSVMSGKDQVKIRFRSGLGPFAVRLGSILVRVWPGFCQVCKRLGSHLGHVNVRIRSGKEQFGVRILSGTGKVRIR